MNHDTNRNYFKTQKHKYDLSNEYYFSVIYSPDKIHQCFYGRNPKIHRIIPVRQLSVLFYSKLIIKNII
jgi:hypothetical protein